MKEHLFKKSAVSCCLVAMISIILPACHFQKGYRLMQKGQHEAAQSHYAKAENHPTYGPGAVFYQEKYNASQLQKPQGWVRIHGEMCGLEAELQQLSERKIRKLFEYDVTRGSIMGFQGELEGKVIDYMKTRGTIAEMETVLADTTCDWARSTGLDSVRTIVVNKTIIPTEPVLEAPSAVNATPRKSEDPPTEAELMEDSTLYCASIALRNKVGITYYDMQAIADRYWEDIVKYNYPVFGQHLNDIWEIFLTYESFCDMPQFKADFPDALPSRDCDFDDASDTLCLGELRPLLAFHRNNPHTFLDNAIAYQIVCLSTIFEDPALNAEEEQQVEDIKLMLRMERHFTSCSPSLEDEELVPKLLYLAEKYTYHRLVFDLAQRGLEYFTQRRELQRALNALDQLQPLFPDKAVCDKATFTHQVYKQQWFDDYRELLLRAIDNERPSRPVKAWNTDDKHEHSLVSWGTSQEVFFVRTDPEKDSSWIVTSKRQKNNKWSAPKTVSELSTHNSTVPLSISEDGRFMLLKQGRNLVQSQRRGLNRPWSRPTPMRLPFESSGRAWLSPKDSLFFIEQYADGFRFDIGLLTDIHRAELKNSGRYGEAKPLHQRINTEEYSEGNTIMGAGGRILFMASDRIGGVGNTDAYSIALGKPRDFTVTDEPVNLGVYINSVYEDRGLTYFSEYTGFGYFDRRNPCTGSRDIWEAELDREVFPPDLMRFAGVVLDEHDKPVPPAGGFMEFTFNYDESNQAVTLSDKGAYFYTIPSQTEVVRLYPEVAGYFSERDTTHHLEDIERGSIVRDTFHVTSFKYIRENFRLKNSTFIYGTAEFDKPKGTYPELTRLAKIATRMGAELELHGHTDESGDPTSNKVLSLERAASVKDFLVDKCGFDPAKIDIYGYGADRPLCEEDTEACRRRNRRIEVKFKMPELPER